MIAAALGALIISKCLVGAVPLSPLQELSPHVLPSVSFEPKAVAPLDKMWGHKDIFVIGAPPKQYDGGRTNWAHFPADQNHGSGGHLDNFAEFDGLRPDEHRDSTLSKRELVAIVFALGSPTGADYQISRWRTARILRSRLARESSYEQVGIFSPILRYVVNGRPRDVSKSSEFIFEAVDKDESALDLRQRVARDGGALIGRPPESECEIQQ